MRILTLGGTRFVGRHIVEAARGAGHEIAVFSRGRTPLPWDDVEHLSGDRETGELEALHDREWDACIDVSAYARGAARASAQLPPARVAHSPSTPPASVSVVDPGGGRDESTRVPPADLDEDAADGSEL